MEVKAGTDGGTPLGGYPTRELVEELTRRPGVEPVIAVSSDSEVTVTFKGPAIVLQVID